MTTRVRAWFVLLTLVAIFWFAVAWVVAGTFR